MRTLKKSGVTALRTIVLFLFAFYHIAIHAQCLVPSGKTNSLLPVTNNYIVRDYGDHLVDHVPASIHKMAASNGTYYLAGDFTALTPNIGSALVLDSGTSTIKTPQQWRINGTVLTAIPDGQGGFYIGGNFTRIGDSTRKYIAQINANGQPTAWNPRADSTVKMLQLRKDTLYISGDFSTIFSRKRSAMAIYSLKGDSLVNSRIYSFSSINSFLLKNDTLIVGGKGRNPIFDDPNMSAFRISDSMYLTYWSLHYEEYGEIDLLRFNADSSIIVYRSDNYGHTIKAFMTQTGALLYKNKLMVYWPYDYAYGKCFSLKLVGNKMYAAGYFETVHGSGGMVTRKGFFSFDPQTGIPSSDQLQIDGYPTFVEEKNGKLFISGNFETINSVPRLNFAVLDTGSLNVNSWQLSPSDPLTTIAFDNGHAFIGGVFNGIGAVARHGLAAIDSATGAILPWKPAIPVLEGIKKMTIKGDTLFLLSVKYLGGCGTLNFQTSLYMYRLSDGQQLTVPRVGDRINDFAIEGDYMYIAFDDQLRKFQLPNMARVGLWGTQYTNDYTPIQLIIKDNKIHTIGDNRFDMPCSTNPTRKGGYTSHDKVTGSQLVYYNYESSVAIGYVIFDHGLLVNNKMYIQGKFLVLRGKERKNLVCIDINTGDITDWQSTAMPNSHFSFNYVSELKLHNGQIWFGSNKDHAVDGYDLPGFNALDTITGQLMHSAIKLDYTSVGHRLYYKSTSFNDFIFYDNNFIGVGSFDYVNNMPATSIAGFSLTPGISSPITPTTITGADTIYTNNKPNKYYITPSDTLSYTYNWTYTGNGVSFANKGGDTVSLSATPGATNGDLIVNAVSYCSVTPVTQKSIVILNPLPPPPVPDVANISDKCYSAATAFAKLMNPPSDVQISILIDGVQVAYQAADSTFKYFTQQQTTTGYHFVNVKYKNTTATMDSSSKTFSYYVAADVTHAILITGNTTVNAGNSTLLTATPTGGGNLPGYQWQDSTRLHTWQNITGAINKTLSYTPDTTGVKVKCILNSNITCASPATVISNSLTFTVNVVTGINDLIDQSAHVLIYPNPATANIVVDSLLASDNWHTVEIVNVHGQKVIPPCFIQNRTQVSIPVMQLDKGLYVLILRRKNGMLTSRTFMKQ